MLVKKRLKNPDDQYKRCQQFTKGRWMVMIKTTNNKVTFYNQHNTSRKKLDHLIEHAKAKGFQVRYFLNDPNYYY